MALSNDIINAINTLTNNATENAPFDKTKVGEIKSINIITNTASVLVDGRIYSDVPVYGRTVDLAVGDIVKLLVPQNNINNIYIISPTKQQDIILTQDTIDELIKIGYDPNI